MIRIISAPFTVRPCPLLLFSRDSGAYAKQLPSCPIEWAQARGHPLPAFTEETPLLVPVAGVLQPRFQYSCRLSWWNVTLPREGYGLDAGKTAPFFQSKKVFSPSSFHPLKTGSAAYTSVFTIACQAVYGQAGPGLHPGAKETAGTRSVVTKPVRCNCSAVEMMFGGFGSCRGSRHSLDLLRRIVR